MPTILQRALAQAGAAGAGRAAVAAVPAKTGFLQRLLEEMNLPGNVVRNILAGNIGGAGRNVADIATLVSGLRLVPGLNRRLALTRKQDRPSWGFAGDILTDPLTWMSFGGAGAAKTLGKAALKGASKRTLTKMLSGQLTGAGRKFLKAQAAKGAAKLATRGGLAARLMKMGGGAQQLAKRRLLRGMVEKGLKGVAPKLLRQGGIGLGIPFRDPIATMFAGKDVIKALPPVRAATALGAPVIEKAKDIFRPLSRIGPEGQRIARAAMLEQTQAAPRAAQTVTRIFQGISDDMAKDITTAIGKFDPRAPKGGVNSLKKLYSKYGGEQLKAVKRAVSGWQDEAGRMLGREKELGLLKGSRIKPEDYMPLQWTQEYAEEVAKASRTGELGRVYGSGVKSRFFKERGYKTLEEFVGAGHEAELDARLLALRRIQSHHGVVANARAIRRANVALGTQPQKITDIARLKTGLPVEGKAQVAAARGLKFTRDVAGDEMTILAKKKGKDVGKAILSKTPDGWEVTRLTGGKKPQAGMVLAAQEAGLPVTFAEHLTLPPQPKLQTLADTALEQWFKAGKMGHLAKRKGIWKSLAKYNQKFFKRFVTSGWGPMLNVKFITRNVMTGVFQGATDDDIALAGLKHFRPMVDGIIHKVADAVGLKYRGSVVSRLLRGATEGIEHAGYSGDDILRLAKQHGAIQTGFAATELAEQIPGVAQKGLLPAGMQKVLGRVRGKIPIKPQMSQRVMEYSENAMRLNGFMELLGKGIDPEQAAQRVTKAFLDYSYTSTTERAIRDLFPFAKFTIEQTPRTVEAIARRPVLTQPWRALATGKERPEVMPGWMEGRPVIPLGQGARGARVMHQFGTPIEDLERLGTGEGFGRTLEQSLIGSLTPPLKMAYQMASGREPFTGKDVTKMTRGPSMMKYLPGPLKKAIGAEDIETKTGFKMTKVPWQVAMALREQPLTVQFRTFDTMYDENKTTLTKTIGLLTGMRVVDIDEEYELKRRIRDYLLSKVRAGEVGEFAKFFATGDTPPELAMLIKEYYKVGRKPKSR